MRKNPHEMLWSDIQNKVLSEDMIQKSMPCMPIKEWHMICTCVCTFMEKETLAR